MKITWLGHSAFKVEGKEISIVHDPFKNILGYKLPTNLLADVVLSSHSHSDHSNVAGVNGEFKLINQVGDCTVGDIDIKGIHSFHDNQEGQKKGNNIIFTYTLDGIKIAHLGDLGHVLSTEQVELLRDIDVLLVPCGGGFTIGSDDAVTVIDQVNPKIVIPMHYRTPALFIFKYKFEKVDNLLDKLNYKVEYQKTLELNTETLENQKRVIILDYK